MEPPDPVPEPPPELRLLWQIQRFSALPYGGGLMNQPHILMRLLTAIADAQDDVLALVKPMKRNSKGSNNAALNTALLEM